MTRADWTKAIGTRGTQKRTLSNDVIKTERQQLNRLKEAFPQCDIFEVIETREDNPLGNFMGIKSDIELQIFGCYGYNANGKKHLIILRSLWTIYKAI